MASDPPPFFHKIIRAWKSIPFPRSRYEDNLPISTPSRVTKMRSLTVAQNRDSNLLPLYANATETENVEYYHPRSPPTQSKTIVNLTFQAALFMFQSMSAPHDQRLLKVAMVIALAASFSEMRIKHSYPQFAAIIEKIGYLSFATGFFVMTRDFFSGSLILGIIGGLIWALTLSAFLIGCLT